METRSANESVGWLNSEGPLNVNPTPVRERASYLTVGQQFNLQHACRLLTAAFGACNYLVGSVLTRPDYRDIDIRCILFDDDYDRQIGQNDVRLKLLNTSISEWLSARTGLPIDFQIQRMTDANREFDGHRHFIGRPLSVEVGVAEGET